MKSIILWWPFIFTGLGVVFKKCGYRWHFQNKKHLKMLEKLIAHRHKVSNNNKGTNKCQFCQTPYIKFLAELYSLYRIQ